MNGKLLKIYEHGFTLMNNVQSGVLFNQLIYEHGFTFMNNVQSGVLFNQLIFKIINS